MDWFQGWYQALMSSLTGLAKGVADPPIMSGGNLRASQGIISTSLLFDICCMILTCVDSKGFNVLAECSLTMMEEEDARGATGAKLTACLNVFMKSKLIKLCRICA